MVKALLLVGMTRAGAQEGRGGVIREEEAWYSPEELAARAQHWAHAEPPQLVQWQVIDEAELWLTAPEGFIGSVRLRVRLGPLEARWSVPVEVSAEASQRLDLQLEEHAYLHPLADEFVSDLTVTLVGRDELGNRVSTYGPALVVHRDDTWRLWTPDQLPERAPGGVVRGPYANTVEPTTRLSPPLFRTPEERQRLLAAEGVTP